MIGASYVALECGGFLAGLGLDVTIMVRSILLRGFDQEMADRAGDHMEEHGIKFLRKYVPVNVSRDNSLFLAFISLTIKRHQMNLFNSPFGCLVLVRSRSWKQALRAG